MPRPGVDPPGATDPRDAPDETHAPDEADAAETARLRVARERILERIAAACHRVGRSPDDIELVAVSKTVAAERLRAAVAAGLTTLGENRVQEAAGKVAQVGQARWELVGPLQSNKARRAIEIFDAIQTVDSADLARRLDRLAGELRPGRRYPILLEVNVDRDPGKAGLMPEEVTGVLDVAADLDFVDVRGLMTIGRLVADPAESRSTFAGLRRLASELRATHSHLGPALSMGMTDDFEIAIEEGATVVRIGRALFGERPHTHHPNVPAHTHAQDPSAHSHDGDATVHRH
jgi:pyridoxal phosphate enzyme (YggS family)